MGATKKDFMKLIQEHNQYYGYLQYEALLYEQLDCDIRPKDIE